MTRSVVRWGLCFSAALLAIAGSAPRVAAHPDQAMVDEFIKSHPEYFAQRFPQYFANDSSANARIVRGGATPAAIPDIFGPGAVLTAGNVNMKVTNLGLFGNPFTNVSSDPSGQWVGASGVEYLSFGLLSVGAVNPVATEPNAIRRVSYFSEWRPPSLNAEDRIYRAYEGIINGSRLVNDDGDRDPATSEQKIDEDFLDGHDNDGDGRIDEDYAALGQQMFSLVMRDDTPEAVNSTFNEKHIPLGLEVQERAFAFANPRLANFDAMEYKIFNRSGHELDSMVVGFRVDMDSGPLSQNNFFTDDIDASPFPNGQFVVQLRDGDPRRQFPHLEVNPPVSPDSALCPRVTYRINGFSVVDDNGDAGRTLGVGSILLLGHTIDPLGVNAPSRVQFRAFRSYTAGTPYEEGGNPSIDQQRFEFMTSTQNIDPTTGLINTDFSELPGDFQAWCSIGPFRHVPNNGSIEVTIAFAVQTGNVNTLREFPGDMQRYNAGGLDGGDLLDKYPALDNALTAQIAYDGIYENPRDGFENLVPGGLNSSPYHGRETPLKARAGQLGLTGADCHDLAEGQIRPITEFEYTWFDFDCDYCTGVYDSQHSHGLYLRHWNTESPPPSPNLNVASTFNYSDNPDRTPVLVPAGDNQITVAWDNLSETTPDPESHKFDFRFYRVWKAANWQRPVGSAGPNDDDWSLLGEFRLYDFADSNFTTDGSGQHCPMVLVPEYLDPVTGTRGPKTVPICLYKGDLWNEQTGDIIRPDPTVDCRRDTLGSCLTESGIDVYTTAPTTHTKYHVGRYRFIDKEVKNGFLYFYSITAGDCPQVSSVFPHKCLAGETEGRRSAQEADGVTPQIAPRTGTNVWVVPNPYRGFRTIRDRPSAWDLTPNASDPTGTHIDFFGMPAGRWTLRIFTVSGDLVAELHSDDTVNESVRTTITNPNGQLYNGANRQQDNANDGQARWNLISRNGQDVVSGIYIFVVESPQGQQRGRFVIIR